MKSCVRCELVLCLRIGQIGGQVQLVNLAVERVAGDAEHLRRQTLIAVRLAQRFGNRPGLEVGEPEGHSRGIARPVGDDHASPLQPRAYVAGTNGGLRGRKYDGDPLDEILELANVSGEWIVL